MNKRFKKYYLALACLVCMIGILMPNIKAHAKTQQEAVDWMKSKVNQSIDADGYAGYQCVDLILAYYDFLGVPRSSGNAAQYASNVLPSGWTRIQGGIPQPGDILVYSGTDEDGGLGHIALYESNLSTYHQNFDKHQYVERITSIAYNGFKNPYWGCIRPNFGNSDSSVAPGYLNIGTSFNAIILRTDIWNLIHVRGGNVVLNSVERGQAVEHWRFDLQNDGSYIITSLYDGKVLDVVNGENKDGVNVAVCGQWGDDNGAQRWYIYSNGNSYRIVPKCAPNKCLDVTGDGKTDGTNIQLFSWNDTGAQAFTIYQYRGSGPMAISIIGSNETIVGDNVQLDIDYGKATGYYGVTWECSDSTIATIDSKGVVSPVSAGTVTITATSKYNDRLKASKILKVNNREVTVSFDANGGTVNPTSKITVNNYLSDLPIPIRTNWKFLGWKDIDNNIISSDTKIINDCTLFASWEPLIIEYNVKFMKDFYNVGDLVKTQDFVATCKYADGTIKNIEILNTDLKSIDTSYSHTQTIKFIHNENGEEFESTVDVKIIETENTDNDDDQSLNTSDEKKDDIVNQNILISKMTLKGDSKQIAAGKKITLIAKVTPSNATNKAVTWSTSNKKYATVNSKGVVTTKKAGAGKSVTITAKAKDGSNIKTKYKISIMKHAVKSIKLSAKTKSVKNGKKLTLKATVKTTGSKANKTLKWSSSNTKYATVSSKGVVTAKKAGKGKKVKITAKATDGTGKKATITIKIK